MTSSYKRVNSILHALNIPRHAIENAGVNYYQKVIGAEIKNIKNNEKEAMK